MATTLQTPTRNAMVDAATALVNVGSGKAAGDIRFRASTTEICVIDFENPAFGSAASGTAAAAGVPLSNNAVAAGTIDNYEVRDRDGTVLWTGSVTATGGGGDVTMDNPVVSSGQLITLTAYSFTQPAS